MTEGRILMNPWVEIWVLLRMAAVLRDAVERRVGSVRGGLLGMWIEAVVARRSTRRGAVAVELPSGGPRAFVLVLFEQAAQLTGHGKQNKNVVDAAK